MHNNFLLAVFFFVLFLYCLFHNIARLVVLLLAHDWNFYLSFNLS